MSITFCCPEEPVELLEFEECFCSNPIGTEDPDCPYCGGTGEVAGLQNARKRSVPSQETPAMPASLSSFFFIATFR